MTGSLAKRYARALAGLARDEGRLEAVLGELERTAAWLADPELAAALASPALPADARRSLLSQITASLELSESVRSFLGILAHNQRLNLFADVVRAYRRQPSVAHWSRLWRPERIQICERCARGPNRRRTLKETAEWLGWQARWRWSPGRDAAWAG